MKKIKTMRNIVAVVWILILAVGIAKNDPLHIGHLLSVIIIFPVLYWGHGVWLESYLNHHTVVRSQESLIPGLYSIVSGDVFNHNLGNGLVLNLARAIIGTYGFVSPPSTSGKHYFLHTFDPDVATLHQNGCIQVSVYRLPKP